MNRIRDYLRWHLPCPLCAAPILSTQLLCADCYASLPWHQQQAQRSVTPLICAFDYQEPISSLILAGKTSRQLDRLHLLGRLVAAALPQHILELPQAILPVPLHVSRLRQRGFNQALELARPLAQRLQLPLLSQGVIRVRATDDQKALQAAARQSNMQAAFALSAPLPYQHIALFDDVVTTGATCAELERILSTHGVERVQIWACARTKQ